MQVFKFALPIFILLNAVHLRAQETETLYNQAGKWDDSFYFTSGLEFIFSFANISYKDHKDGSLPRFAPFFNIQSFFNYDPSDYYGFMTGVAIRNVGFVYEIPDSDIKMKYRTYNIGIPFGIKLGNLDKTFLYGGYEVEFPIHYKEKMFVNGDKEDKTKEWFSDRVQPIQSSLYLGVQLPYALNIRFKYYLSQFFNRDFTELSDGVAIQPYEDIEARIFYFSLSFNPFRGSKLKVRVN